MSSVNVNWVAVPDAETAWSNTKSRLEEDFSFAIDEGQKVLNKIKNLVKGLLDIDVDVSSFLTPLKKLREESISNLTLEMVRRNRHIRFVDSQIGKLNRELLRLKRVYADISIGDYEILLERLKKLFNVDLEGEVRKLLEEFEASSKLSSSMKKNILHKYEAIFSNKEVFCKQHKQIKKELKKINKILKNSSTNDTLYNLKLLSKVKPELDKVVKNLEKAKEEDFKKREEEFFAEIGKKQDRKNVDKLKEDIRGKLKKLKKIDKDIFEKVAKEIPDYEKEKNSFRLKVILDSIKRELYQCIKVKSEDYVYRSEIESFIQSKFEDVRNLALEKIKKKYIKKEDFEEVYNLEKKNFLKEIEEINLPSVEELTDTVVGVLRDKGYKFIKITEDDIKKLKKGKSVLFDTIYGEDYKIELKFGKGLINAKIVRTVPDEFKPSEYEKEKEVEVARRWCDDYAELLNSIESLGAQVKTIERVGPERGVEYIRIGKRELKTKEKKELEIKREKEN